ncbi:hypothetical protein NUU61_007779 [Penicillium alfredii]|uniref:Beta-glucuronidase C-terminal domain-containing protein n=1 Tax=Penicillium alfredii TaxID=1506179 RepID=A0A9W9ER58_9EURO|nr:uncharacterized protein NUU61_007779 [Penicillium alfredii]KAJ5086472.1 hypothetical protein NUU61_007779 [Penicillium alfredii]
MMLLYSALLGTALFLQSGQCQFQPISIPSLPKNSNPVSNDLQAFSIEFAFFPDYAGNKSHPNTFSKTLLDNFKQITGVLPKVRVGGTSQDHSDYFPNQKENVKLIYEKPTDDQPIQINYGPGYFESYHTLGDIQFLHGLNMNQNKSVQQLESAATKACTSIGPQLHLFELGNEWNFAPGKYRPANYSLLDYSCEWNRKAAVVKAAVQKACPGPFPGFMAPSFVLLDLALSKTTWTAEGLFHLGYDEKNLTKELSFHNYMGVNAPPLPPAGFDLQKTLMNHTNMAKNLAPQIQRARNLQYLGHPFTLGELNSIANQGRNGETNVFGDALWLVDFSFWAAEHNIKRLHFHQGLNYRYASWQPITSKGVPPTTRPPYYGQIMVATALGHAKDSRIVNIPLSEDTESAYAIYNGKRLSKLAVLNLRAFNQTTTKTRPDRKYLFQLPKHSQDAKIERLTAPGSDALQNVTFGGVSYGYGLKQGKPVVVDSKEEKADIKNGVLSIDIPDSSAALVTFL